MGSFDSGMQMGSGIASGAFQYKRQAEKDAQERYRFGLEQEAAQRAATNRADLGYIAQRGDTGITPNMTTAGPTGMGPVADARDVGLATPMTDSEQQTAIGKVALRSGDVQGFNAARESARSLTMRDATDKLGKKLLTMDDDALMKEYAPIFQQVNKDPNAPHMFGWDEKTKHLVKTDADGNMHRMNGAEIRANILAAHQIGNGDVATGVNSMLGLATSQRQQAGEASDRSLRDATAQGGDYRAGEHLALDRQRTGNQAAHNAAIIQHLNQGQFTQMRDKDTGEVVSGFVKPDGSFVRSKIPDNLVPIRASRPDVTTADVLKMTDQIMNSGKNPVTNKPYTVQEAHAAATQMLQGGGDGPGVDVDFGKLKDALKNGTQAPPQGGTGLQIPSAGINARTPAQQAEAEAVAEAGATRGQGGQEEAAARRAAGSLNGVVIRNMDPDQAAAVLQQYSQYLGTTQKQGLMMRARGIQVPLQMP
jgi:hypothetical protein